MTDSLKIKVTLAGRVYPIKVRNAEEEEGMRKAANKINNLVTKFEKSYAVSDKQDVLAMCALQFASLIEINSITDQNELVEVSKKLSELDALIDAQLE